MNITIIGGSGFVGSFLIKELEGFNIRNLDKNPSHFFNDVTLMGDIRNFEEIKIPKGTDSVVLLAAEFLKSFLVKSLVQLAYTF